MIGHLEAPKNPPSAGRLFSLLPYKHPAPVSLLECALPRLPTTVHSKQLTRSAKSFRMRSYTKTGGRGPRPFPPSLPPFTQKETTASSLPYILPSSVYSNSFVFTLFTKLPGRTLFLPILVQLARSVASCVRTAAALDLAASLR